MKAIKWIDENFEIFLMGICLIVMTMVIFVDILLRTIAGSGLIWAQELARTMTIFTAELGMSFGISTKKHIRVDILETFIPKLGTPLNIFADIVTLIFCAVIAFYGVSKMQSVYSMGVTTPVMELPNVYIYAVTEIGLALGVVRCIERNVKDYLRNKNGGGQTA